MILRRKLYKKYIDLAKEQFERSDPKNQTSKYLNEHRKVYLINTLILLELALESFINDFGYSNVINYEFLERVPIKNRIVILPKIAKNNPKDIIKDDTLYKDLTDLIKYRNIFVHRDSEEKLDKVFDRLDHKLVNKFYKAVVELMLKYNNHFKMLPDDDRFIADMPETWI